MPLRGDRKPFSVVSSGGVFEAEVSPDGKWLAYTKNNGGEREVEVIPFPRGAGQWQVSANGGSDARWRGDSKELFYLSPDKQIMAAEIIDEGSSVAVGKISTLFKIEGDTAYDVSPDGKRFLVVTGVEQKDSQTVMLVTNWTGLLKKQ